MFLVQLDLCLFVLRFYGPVNPIGSCLARSVYLTTRLLGRPSIVHILSPETDNCPSWISGRERMTVENISWSISTKECCRPRRGLNPRLPCLQSDGASNWATEAGNSSMMFFCSLLLRLNARSGWDGCVCVWGGGGGGEGWRWGYKHIYHSFICMSVRGLDMEKVLSHGTSERRVTCVSFLKLVDLAFNP